MSRVYRADFIKGALKWSFLLVGKHNLLESWAWNAVLFQVTGKDTTSFKSNVVLLQYLLMHRYPYSAHDEGAEEVICHSAYVWGFFW